MSGVKAQAGNRFLASDAGASVLRSFTLGSAADEKGPIAARAYNDEPFRVDGTEARAGTL